MYCAASLCCVMSAAGCCGLVLSSCLSASTCLQQMSPSGSSQIANFHSDVSWKDCLIDPEQVGGCGCAAAGVGGWMPLSGSCSGRVGMLGCWSRW